MEAFTKYLEEQGYETYRLISTDTTNPIAKKNAEWMLKEFGSTAIPVDSPKMKGFLFPLPFNHTYPRANFNTQLNGGIFMHFIKDFDFDNAILIGLREHEMPPTLIWPRPRIAVYCNIYGREFIMDEVKDEAMAMVFALEKPEDIFTALYDRSIIFEYKTPDLK